MWLAPNLITLLGIIGLILAYLLTSYFLPDLDGRCHRRATSALHYSCLYISILIGLTVVNIAFLCLSGNAPRWVYWFNGLAVLAYLHLDCIDGKQARRTKSSSPLGQLFDHGTSFFS